MLNAIFECLVHSSTKAGRSADLAAATKSSSVAAEAANFTFARRSSCFLCEPTSVIKIPLSQQLKVMNNALGLVRSVYRFLLPLDDLQVQNSDAVQNRNQKQGDKGGNPKATNLRITQRLPERASVNGKREESDDGCSDRNHHWPQTLNTRIA